MSIVLPGGFALVTGAGNGIGRATAIAYAKSGVAGICLADVALQAAEDVLLECKNVATHPNFQGITVHTDVSKEEDVKAMVQKAVDTFGRIDYAANVAGVVEASRTKAPETTLDTWDRINSINTRGVFMCMREEIAAMLKNEPAPMTDDGPPIRGAIVNVGSVASKVAEPLNIAYTASKHAVSGMTKSAAASHGTDFIRINTICPGAVITNLASGSTGEINPAYKETVERILARTMMKRLAAPVEIANQIVWMNSPMNSYMTGAEVVVDGGLLG